MFLVGSDAMGGPWLIWNVRGMGRSSKRRVFKKLGWVQNRGRRPWRLFHVWDRIDLLLPEVNCVEIRHVLREGNDEADFLAKSGREGDLVLWQICD